MALKTWLDAFGDEYVDRNMLDRTGREALKGIWRRILGHALTPSSVLEVGCGSGNNLEAIEVVRHSAERPRLVGIEPNLKARELALSRGFEVYEGTTSDLSAAEGQFDMVFTSGVLIHVDDANLSEAMVNIIAKSSRWVVAIEYFAAIPTPVRYRDMDKEMWLRDYGTIYRTMGLNCLGYGWNWAPMSGYDTVNWWVFEKP